MPRTAKAGGLVLAGVLALGACGGTTVVEAGAPAGGGKATGTPAAGNSAAGNSAAGNPETPVTSGSQGGDEPVDATPEPEIVKPRAGMDNVHRIGWDRAEVLSPKKVRIHYYGGVAPCDVLDSVKVKLGAKAVTVTLRSGSDPAKPDMACIEIAKAMAVDVTLAEPLAGRKILDPADVPVEAPAGAPAGKRAPTADEDAKVVVPRPGMADPVAQGWDKAVATGDRTVRVYFTSGVEPCTVLDTVKVTYTADKIVITMTSGRDPKVAADTACIMLAEYRAVDVVLTQDIGTREFVDGTAE